MYIVSCGQKMQINCGGKLRRERKIMYVPTLKKEIVIISGAVLYKNKWRYLKSQVINRI